MKKSLYNAKTSALLLSYGFNFSERSISFFTDYCLPISKVDLDLDLVNYFISQGLFLPNNEETETSHLILNLEQYIWLKILSELKVNDFTSEQIKKCHRFLYCNTNEDENWAWHQEFNPDLQNDIKFWSVKSSIVSDKKRLFSSTIKKNGAIQTLLPSFLLNPYRVFYVPKNGNEFRLQIDLGQIPSDEGICISINSIFFELLTIEPLACVFEQYEFFFSHEKEIIDAAKEGRLLNLEMYCEGPLQTIFSSGSPESITKLDIIRIVRALKTTSYESLFYSIVTHHLPISNLELSPDFLWEYYNMVTIRRVHDSLTFYVMFDIPESRLKIVKTSMQE